jgi:hypothetical protein
MTEDLDLQGHWGRYLCILCAGFLENALREVYGDLARARAAPEIAGYVGKALEGVQNPKAQRFVEIAGSFDPEWGKGLEEFLGMDDGHRRNAIDSIMSNRHLIAHGRNSNISVSRVREYLSAGIEVVEFVETQCGTKP